MAGLGTCAALAIAAPSARAVDVDAVGAWRRLGADVELGKPERLRQDGGGTVLAGLRFGLPIHDLATVEVEALGGRSQIPITNELAVSEVGATLIEGRAQLRLGYAFGRVEPFALIGGAITRSIADGSEPGTEVANDTDLSSHGGVGVRLRLLAGLHLRLDARLSLTGTTVKGASVAQDWGGTASLGWRFGGADADAAERGRPGDVDGDGVDDDADRCPREPETRNGLRDDDGCPEDPRSIPRFHRNGYESRDGGVVATLHAPAAPLPAGATQTRDPRLVALDPPVPVAPDALPPLVGPGDDDGDGLIRADDACPDEPEDADGFADSDGCPEPDNDEDGIPDERDRCPLEAETVNGARDDDGCPEDPFIALRATRTRYGKGADGSLVATSPDKALPEASKLAAGALPALASNGDDDGDGLPASEDVCPAEAEDKDGFADDDGCPDPDNDEDGVLDANDRCPTEGETRNGWDDHDGCPDLLPALLLERVGRIDGLVFANNSAQLLPASEAVLQKLLAAMQEYAQIAVEIAGHTDNKGKPLRNRELSLQRAESVRDWLVARGIAAARIRAAGYGPDKPVADNRKEKGRALNRRVEFNLVVPPAERAPGEEEVAP